MGDPVLLTVKKAWQFTPEANNGMFSAQSGDLSLKEHKPV